MKTHRPLPFILLLLLGACASRPSFDTGGVDRRLTPDGVAADPGKATGKQVLWGGIIEDTTHLPGRTEVEVQAYPLDTDSRPRGDLEPRGYFIIEQAGHLEPTSYSKGRVVTVVGTVTGTRPGQVGGADYDYPIVTARQHHLWSMGGRRSGLSSIFIGGGSGGSGVGFGF